MTPTQREALRELMRRADEVRGMTDRSELPLEVGPENSQALLQTLNDLVEELERSHRRLIETNVQLVSLREVASSMAASLDQGETTRTVTRYLCRAFGFEDVFLLLINRENACLEGTWTRDDGEGRHDRSADIELPLLGDHGAITRCLWLNRTLVHHAAGHNPPRWPPEASDRMNTPSSASELVIRRRSPRIAPPDTGLDGSTATMPTVNRACRNAAT